MFLPVFVGLGVRYDVTIGAGHGGVSDPEVSVRPGAVVAETLYEYRRVVHSVRRAIDAVRILLQGSDQLAVVIGSVSGITWKYIS